MTSQVQRQAYAMFDEVGFFGVPLETFESAGRQHFVRLVENGLLPESRVLDIGCGCLRVAYWLVRFLEPDRYCGIEPARERVELGGRFLFTQRELAAKRPRFDYNAEFDTSVFGGEFDFFLAGSIWTHCSKMHLETTLDGFVRNTGPDGVLLASYLPAECPDDDYMGDSWVGTSHESQTPGVIRHSLDWIVGACERRSLRVTLLGGVDDDSQPWLRLDK